MCFGFALRHHPPHCPSNGAVMGLRVAERSSCTWGSDPFGTGIRDGMECAEQGRRPLVSPSHGG